jgi:hypothetical protein
MEVVRRKEEEKGKRKRRSQAMPEKLAAWTRST